MQPFTKHTGIVAPMDRANVDTDQIIPAVYLKRIERTGFGPFLFAAWRFQPDGSPNPDFILNAPGYQGAEILVAGPNFGCGSSREHAPQALMRFGFDAFVGGSFAEIFAGNCTALGLPSLVLGNDDLAALMDTVELDPAQRVTVDIEAQTVTSLAGVATAAIPAGTRQQLLEGTWNATAVLLDAGAAIEDTAEQLPYIAGF